MVPMVQKQRGSNNFVYNYENPPCPSKLLSSLLPSQSQLQEHTLGSSSMNADKILSSNVLETVFFVNQLFFFLIIMFIFFFSGNCCRLLSTQLLL